MYGTIARVQVKPGMLEQLQQFGDEVTSSTAPKGLVFEHTFQSDSNPNEVWLVIAFTSREAYHANASDPAQHESFLKMRAMLDADPVWHDGEIITSHTA